jgi:predicted nucleic acid-binding protein
MKKMIITTAVATGLFLTGGATGLATSDWFENTLSKSISEVQATEVDSKSLFKQKYAELKEEIVNQVSDMTVEQKNNVEYELEAHRDEKLKLMEEEMIGDKLQEARQRIMNASGKAYQDGVKQIDKEYEEVMKGLK